MIFDWDDANIFHLARHSVTPDEAEQVFWNKPLDLEVQDDLDDIHHYCQIGETDRGRILVTLATVRGSSVRVISAWDASKAYKLFYLREKAKQTWQG